jgi:uncharacterized LabA/DUF88 family protein
MAEKAGFETTIEDRNVAGQEKRVDTGIVTAIMADAYTIIKKGNDEIILVAGDGDYVPTVEHLIKNGHYMDVFFWDHASLDLKKACRRFRPLDPHLKNIQFDKI